MRELGELTESVFEGSPDVIGSAGGPLVAVFERSRSAPAGDGDFLVGEAVAKAFAEVPRVRQTPGGERGDENDSRLLLGDMLQHFGDEVFGRDNFDMELLLIKELLEEGERGDFGTIAGWAGENG